MQTGGGGVDVDRSTVGGVGSPGRGSSAGRPRVNTCLCGDNMDSKTTVQIFLLHAPPSPCVWSMTNYAVELLMTKAFFRSDVVNLVQL